MFFFFFYIFHTILTASALYSYTVFLLVYTPLHDLRVDCARNRCVGVLAVAYVPQYFKMLVVLAVRCMTRRTLRFLTY